MSEKFSGETSWVFQPAGGGWFWVPWPIWSLDGVCFPMPAFMVDRGVIDSWVTCGLAVLWVTGLDYPSWLCGFLLASVDVINPVILCIPCPERSQSTSSSSLHCQTSISSWLLRDYPFQLSFQLLWTVSGMSRLPTCFMSRSILEVGPNWKTGHNSILGLSTTYLTFYCFHLGDVRWKFPAVLPCQGVCSVLSS